MVTSDYLHNVLDPAGLREAAANTANRISALAREHGWECYEYAIAFQGMSGCLVGPMVATFLNKPMIMVRKESSHSHHKVEGNLTVAYYIMVDDFTESGTTLRHIVQRISEVSLARPLAMVCYKRDSDMKQVFDNIPVYGSRPL